ncbi:hypothetical protein [Vibrio owensii]|uniref:hypothetical protein n=1 Tax=Vibrio owensii TaxID=696485 RepID=UPI00391B68B7
MIDNKRRINKALIMSWGGVIINFGGFLIILPIATKNLNLPELNFWLYSTTLLAVGMIIESSIVNPFNRLLSYAKNNKPINNGNGEFSANNISDSLYIMSRLSIIFSVIVFVLTYAIGFVSTAGFEDLSDVNIYLVLISLVCLLRVLSTFFIAILHTEALISLQKEIQFYLLLIKTVITIVILTYYNSLLLVFVLNTIIVLLECLVYSYIAFAKLGYYQKINEGKYNRSTVESIKKPVSNTLIIRVGGYFIAQSMAILAIQLPVEESTLILFSVKCVSLVYRVSLMPFHVKLPYFVKLRAVDEIEKIRSSYIKEVRLSLSVYIVGSLFLIFFAKEIAQLVDVKVYFLSSYQLAFLCLIFFFELHHVTHSMIYETTNDVPFVKISLVSGIMIFALGLLSNNLGYGIIGLLWVQFLVQLAGNNWYSVYLSLKSLNWKFNCYIKDMFGVKNDNIL